VVHDVSALNVQLLFKKAFVVHGVSALNVQLLFKAFL
jgi:hypothetical protein